MLRSTKSALFGLHWGLTLLYTFTFTSLTYTQTQTRRRRHTACCVTGGPVLVLVLLNVHTAVIISDL